VVEIVDSLEVYFPDLQPHEPPRFHEILLPVPVRLPQVIQALNLPLEDIKRLNPAYRRGVWNGRLTVPAGYPLRLPETVDAATVLAYLQLQNPAYAQKFRGRNSGKRTARSMPIAYRVLPESRACWPNGSAGRMRTPSETGERAHAGPGAFLPGLFHGRPRGSGKVQSRHAPELTVRKPRSANRGMDKIAVFRFNRS